MFFASLALFGVVSGTDTIIQLSGNETGCQGDPHGDRLENLCGTGPDIVCCLFTESSGNVALSVKGGSDAFMRTLLSQLSRNNITHFSLEATSVRTLTDINLCNLAGLQALRLYLAPIESLRGIRCLRELRQISLAKTMPVTVQDGTFQGLSHLSWVDFYDLDLLLLAPLGMLELQSAAYISLTGINLVDVDVWPLCLAQTNPGITVILRSNRIKTFTNRVSYDKCNVTDPPQPNVTIDLRDNNITSVSVIVSGWGFPSLQQFVISLLSRTPGDKFPIELDSNPFTCSCADRDLYEMLKDIRYSSRLTNLGRLVCQQPQTLRGRRFDTISVSELHCDFPLAAILSASGVAVVALPLVFFGFLFYNRIRLYRWSRYKLHPWNLDECDNEDKEFDVFVSYATEDESWILGLVGELETRGFKVLFHMRDFEAGMTILENVTNAVAKSKRTICVLSPNFVASSWCSWEFITVLNDDIDQHRRRLLLVVKERVAWDNLSLAMRHYMRDFTYIDAESRYFMDNLLYSLPVKRLGSACSARSGSDIHNTDMGEGDLAPSDVSAAVNACSDDEMPLLQQ